MFPLGLTKHSYTVRREAFSRRRAAMRNAATGNGDLENGSQQQQQQAVPPAAYGNRLPRYESLYGISEPGHEYWPLEEVRLVPPRRVMTEPTPEGQKPGSAWAAPWATAEDPKKYSK